MFIRLYKCNCMPWMFVLFEWDPFRMGIIAIDNIRFQIFDIPIRMYWTFVPIRTIEIAAKDSPKTDRPDKIER